MTNLGKFMDGLYILSHYYENGMDTFDFCQAEHDQIYFFVYDVTENDAKRLEDLGFFIDDNDGWSY